MAACSSVANIGLSASSSDAELDLGTCLAWLFVFTFSSTARPTRNKSPIRRRNPSRDRAKNRSVSLYVSDGGENEFSKPVVSRHYDAVVFDAQ